MTPIHRSALSPSKNGAKAREQLIAAAGEVFAEKGFQGATSREICLRAGANLAAVNYHFGGFEALYRETLKVAHERAIWIEPVGVEGFEKMPPREKLRAVLGNLVNRMVQSEANGWEMRLVSRELFIPTFAQTEFITTLIEPRRAFLKAIIGDIVNLPPDDPRVGRCVLTVIAPCLMISIVSQSSLETLLPDVGGAAGRNALADHVVRFAMAGLEAIAHQNMEEAG